MIKRFMSATPFIIVKHYMITRHNCREKRINQPCLTLKRTIKMHKRHGRGQSSKSGAIFWRKHNIVWAIFYEWQGRYEAGEQAFREAAVVGVEAGNLIWHGRFLCILGEVETAVSQLQQALDLLEQTGLTTKEEQ